MTQLLTTATSRQFAPVYSSDLTRTIGVLQQLQILCSAQSSDPSLADVIGVVRAMQLEFGEDSHLENVIQSLVGQYLSQQVATRRQRQHLEAVEVLP